MIVIQSHQRATPIRRPTFNHELATFNSYLPIQLRPWCFYLHLALDEVEALIG